jgi:hypothetical protein
MTEHAAKWRNTRKSRDGEPRAVRTRRWYNTCRKRVNERFRRDRNADNFFFIYSSTKKDARSLDAEDVRWLRYKAD